MIQRTMQLIFSEHQPIPRMPHNKPFLNFWAAFTAVQNMACGLLHKRKKGKHIIGRANGKVSLAAAVWMQFCYVGRVCWSLLWHRVCATDNYCIYLVTPWRVFTFLWADSRCGHSISRTTLPVLFWGLVLGAVWAVKQKQDVICPLPAGFFAQLPCTEDIGNDIRIMSGYKWEGVPGASRESMTSPWLWLDSAFKLFRVGLFYYVRKSRTKKKDVLHCGTQLQGDLPNVSEGLRLICSGGLLIYCTFSSYHNNLDYVCFHTTNLI